MSLPHRSGAALCNLLAWLVLSGNPLELMATFAAALQCHLPPPLPGSGIPLQRWNRCQLGPQVVEKVLADTHHKRTVPSGPRQNYTKPQFSLMGLSSLWSVWHPQVRDCHANCGFDVTTDSKSYPYCQICWVKEGNTYISHPAITSIFSSAPSFFFIV